MQPYHLAKLVQWAGKLHARKRLQKVAYLLQASGCKELDAAYILHHYGPYSFDVASTTDQLVSNGLLKESASPNNVGTQYSYELSDAGNLAIEQLEQSPAGVPLAPFKAQERRARALLDVELSALEYGSTMAYFYKQTGDWDLAVQKTCDFKKLKKDGADCKAALKLAKEYVQ